MRINENTTLEYLVKDNNGRPLAKFNTRKQANEFVYQRDEHGEDTTLWSVVPQKIEMVYELTDMRYGEDDHFHAFIDSLSDLIEGLRLAKAEGLDHIHFCVCGKVNNSICTNTDIAEIVIPLISGYKGSIYVRGI